ncbi:TPA: UDP-N-acetylglucosamine 2-epimerase (non-hydrolyzing), partial [Candidatus Micrarchaeota archaeon]|nr:UDP-N-acetylglucosamine 2-epimerase (non-hydrolyzing) [Candidatus Micrarchaeota archaeon]
MTKKRVLIILGTRPEVIKLAPLYQVLSERPLSFEVRLLATGQHREMLHQALEIFALKPDYDLDVMRKNQDLYSLTTNILIG